MTYDLVVVGAGPSGATCARIAAEKGLKVALVDKRSRIGVPKQCAEGINKQIFDMIDLKIKDEWVSRWINSVLIGKPGSGSVYVNMRSKGAILNRKIFDADLADMAESAGAKLIKSTNVIGLNKNNTQVKLRSGKHLDTRIVVGADGPYSTVCKSAGLGPIQSGIGMQYEIKAKSEYPSTLQAYVSNKTINSGYAWVFPKEKTLNVGIGSFVRIRLKDKLDNFVKMLGIKGKILETNAGLIPLSGPIPKFYSKNLMLIGDAAAHTNPMTGGGIPVGMFDGKLAAEVAVDELETGRMDFSKYQDVWWNGIYGEVTKHSLLVRKYYLICLTRGYYDKYFDRCGKLELTGIFQLPKAVLKERNLKALFYYMLCHKNFLKYHKYAW